MSRRSKKAVWGFAAVLGLFPALSCTKGSGAELELGAIEPDMIFQTDEKVPAHLRGENFLGVIRTQLDSKDPAELDRSFGVVIAGMELASEDVTYVDPTRIDILIPASLVVGSHDVTVIGPDGRRSTLFGGLTVNDPPTGTIPSEVVPGQRSVSVAATIENPTAGDMLLSGMWMTFDSDTEDRASEYIVRRDYRNPDLIAPGGSAELLFDVDVDESATLGPVDVRVKVEAFFTDAQAFQTTTVLGTWDVVAGSVPAPAILAPSSAVRLCSGETQAYQADTSDATLTFDWVLSGGSPGQSDVADPVVMYGTSGTFPTRLTATNADGDSSSLWGPLVFVGEPGGGSPYPTGAISFSNPASGADVDLQALPAFDQDVETLQCDGTAVPDGRLVTVFSDRLVIDSALDQDAQQDGIQVAMGANVLGSLPVQPGEHRVGPGLVYAQYEAPTGEITSAGWRTFQAVNDAQGPIVDAEIPLEPDCSPACYGKEERWLYRFSEPIDESTLSSLVIEQKGSSCGGGNWTDVTAGSTWAYDPASRTIAIWPQLGGAMYANRVSFGAEVLDTSGNPLTPFSSCHVLNNRQPPAPPPAPVSVTATDSSPDGDGIADEAQFDVEVSSVVTAIRVEITRGPYAVRTLVEPVLGAGTHTFTWDGRDATGRIVPNGYYRWAVTVENTTGDESASVEGVIHVDGAADLVGLTPRF